MLILSLTLTFFLLFLVYERIVLNKLRRSVPLVIAVTGTRGKSSVVRMLASVLRESGRTVLAKTTGSQAQIILPNGTIQDIPRRGIVSILEQKKILHLASGLRADCLVVEIMSIHPENHRVESQEILKPNIVLITNVRWDHLEAMGESEAEIARVLEIDVPPAATVYVPNKFLRLFENPSLRKKAVRLNAVNPGSADSLISVLGAVQKTEFAENLELVATVTHELGIGTDILARGIEKASHDIGKLRIWEYRIGEKRIFLVNAFAANDPESTKKVMEKTREIFGDHTSAFTGLLNLRFDRGDRTVQWIEAMNAGMSSQFNRIYAMGGHAHAFRRKVPSVSAVSDGAPGEITRSIASEMENDGILFGFGNIGGAGHRLVEFWQQEGKEYGI